MGNKEPLTNKDRAILFFKVLENGSPVDMVGILEGEFTQAEVRGKESCQLCRKKDIQIQQWIDRVMKLEAKV